MNESGPSSGNGRPCAIVALGSNLPHAGLSGAALLEAAIAALGEAGLAVLARSSVWASRAWPPSDQPDFVNAAIVAAPGGRFPTGVMAVLLEIEGRFGRVRAGAPRWAARTLDLDLVDYGGLILDEPGLTLPHPRAHERAFVLAPLAEAAPDWRHPVLGRSAEDLLTALPDSHAGVWRPG